MRVSKGEIEDDLFWHEPGLVEPLIAELGIEALDEEPSSRAEQGIAARSKSFGRRPQRVTFCRQTGLSPFGEIEECFL